MTGHAVGSIVAWTYHGEIQLGSVEGVRRGPDDAPDVYWCRPLRARLDRLVGRAPADLTVVATWDQLHDHAVAVTPTSTTA